MEKRTPAADSLATCNINSMRGAAAAREEKAAARDDVLVCHSRRCRAAISRNARAGIVSLRAAFSRSSRASAQKG